LEVVGADLMPAAKFTAREREVELHQIRCDVGRRKIKERLRSPEWINSCWKDSRGDFKFS
jgi:hypothetical protein